MTSVHIATDTRILYKECATLAAAGHEVSLVATDPGHWDHDTVRLVPIPRPTSRRRRAIDTTRAVFRAARDLHADVYHFHDPELIPAGLALMRRNGASRPLVVYDVHEDNPAEILAKEWITPVLRRPAAAGTNIVEKLASSRFDLIVAATPKIALRFPRQRTVTVQNFPRVDELATPSSTPFGEREPIVAFVGDLTVIRGALDMVRAVALVPDALDARLVLAGRINPPALEAQIDALTGRDRTSLVGWQTRDEVRSLLSRARLGLVLLHPTPNHLEAQPNKLFEYMSAGLPVIASRFPKYREIVEGADCGLTVDPQDPRAIADAIAWLLEHPADAEAMGRRGREAVARQYSWESEAHVLLDAYDRLAADIG